MGLHSARRRHRHLGVQLAMLRRLLLRGALLVAGATALVGAAAAPRELVPLRIQIPAGDSGALRVVQADSHGRAYLFRGDTLDVYGFDGRGRLGAPTRLYSPLPLKGSVDFAAMGEAGDEWLASAGGDLIQFRNGRSQAVPDLPWMATSIAWLDGRPAAGVVPVSFGRPIDPGDPPLVMTLESRGWDRFASTKLAKPVSDRHPVDVLFANHSNRLVSPAGGSGLWVSRPYAGQLTHYSSGGVPNLEVLLGRGEPSYRRDQDQVQRATTESARRAGYDMAKTTTIAFTARMAIRGMAAGRDGTLYVLAAASGQPPANALFRLEPNSTVLESLPIRLDLDGEVSMAAGKDALYISPLRGRPEVWRVAMEDLDQAAWAEVSQAEGRVRKPH